MRTSSRCRIFPDSIPASTQPPIRQQGGGAEPVAIARYSEAVIDSRRVRIQVGIVLGAVLVLVLPASGGAQEINKTLSRLNLEIVGISVDMPDGQYIGEFEQDTERDVRITTTPTRIIYRWDAELTPGDRVTTDRLLAIEHFRWAGLPMVPGPEVSLTEGMFGPERFRLGGTLTSLNIQGKRRYEIRAHVRWSIYDTETSKLIIDKETKGLAKGTALGVRGEQPNVLMDSVIDSLEEFLDEDGEEAIKAARG